MPSSTNRDLTTTLVAGLKQMILDGDLHHGAKLPPERELACEAPGTQDAPVGYCLPLLPVGGDDACCPASLLPDLLAVFRGLARATLLQPCLSFRELFEVARKSTVLCAPPQ